jgi:hypothetical protein
MHRSIFNNSIFCAYSQSTAGGQLSCQKHEDRMGKRRSEKHIVAKLKRQYLNPKLKYSFSGKSNIKRNLSKKEQKYVSKVLSTIPAYTLHRKAIRKFRRRKIFIPSIDDQWVCDLLDVSKYSRFNSNVKFLLTCIDGFSRFAWVEPIKNKQGSTVTDAFSNILNRAKPRKPRLLQFDKGKEFLNSHFLELLKTNNIQHFCVESELKASLVEVFNKTLFTRIARYLTYKKTKRFVDILQQFVYNYNQTFHKGILTNPSNVNKSNESEIFANQYGGVPMKATKPSVHHIGEKVLVARLRSLFEKGHTTHFKDEPFFIDRIGNTEPRMYYLRDMSGEAVHGGFYQQQLLSIDHVLHA